MKMRGKGIDKDGKEKNMYSVKSISVSVDLFFCCDTLAGKYS